MQHLEEQCFLKAQELILKQMVSKDTDLFQLTDTLIALEKEKIEKNEKSDKSIDFNDEIISIEDLGELETTDISVSGDNLFYCNGILTKNSWGLPSTVDFMIAGMSTEELEKMNQLLFKQLKNRYNDTNENKRFTIGIDRSKMRMYDIDDPIAGVCNPESDKSNQQAAQTPFSMGQPAKKQFTGFKV